MHGAEAHRGRPQFVDRRHERTVGGHGVQRVCEAVVKARGGAVVVGLDEVTQLIDYLAQPFQPVAGHVRRRQPGCERFQLYANLGRPHTVSVGQRLDLDPSVRLELDEVLALELSYCLAYGYGAHSVALGEVGEQQTFTGLQRSQHDLFSERPVHQFHLRHGTLPPVEPYPNTTLLVRRLYRASVGTAVASGQHPRRLGPSLAPIPDDLLCRVVARLLSTWGAAGAAGP